MMEIKNERKGKNMEIDAGDRSKGQDKNSRGRGKHDPRPTFIDCLVSVGLCAK